MHEYAVQDRSEICDKKICGKNEQIDKYMILISPDMMLTIIAANEFRIPPTNTSSSFLINISLPI